MGFAPALLVLHLKGASNYLLESLALTADFWTWQNRESPAAKLCEPSHLAHCVF
jgi:hypothetical protein